MSLRGRLTTLIFGSPTLPSDVPLQSPGAPDVVSIGVSPVALDTGGNVSRLYSRTGAEKLLIIHQGHADDDGSLGVADAGRAAWAGGCDVLVVSMPGFCGNAGSRDHNTYTSLRPFLLPTIAALNAVAANYSQVAMAGVSGGGWTATVAAAIDERIDVSIPVAGSLPWFLRAGASLGDWEQSAVLSVCDYPALYALGTTAERKQIQVLNRYDSDAFARAGANGAYGDNYRTTIVEPVNAVASVGGGEFAWLEDVSHTEHKISTWAINNAILPALGITPMADVIVDDGDVGFSIVGARTADNVPCSPVAWTRWTGQGNGADAFTAPPNPECRAAWNPSLPPGTYEVRASFSAHANRASNAKYEIFDGATKIASVLVNQRVGSGVAWQSLGSWTFATSPCVELTNSGADGFVVADAVRFLEGA